MRTASNLRTIPDDELLRRLSALLGDSRRVEADLVARIAEVDHRKLYAREAAPSMFEYCTRFLHLSEHEAYLRITVARVAREYPVLLTMLHEGRLHLSGIARLAPHLNPDNAAMLLERATHQSKRHVEELLAELAPRPDAPTVVRKLPDRRGLAQPHDGPDRVESNGLRTPLIGDGVPTPLTLTRGEAEPDSAPEPDATVDSARTGLDPLGRCTVAAGGPGSAPAAGLSATPSPRSVIEPLAPARYKVQFTASVELRDKLERLQALMRSSVPDGDLAALIEQAVTEKIERLEARRFARTSAPRQDLAGTDSTPKSRHIPAAVRRAVHERDGGRCTYRGTLGRRCPRRHDLEFHHRTPFARGGDHSVEVLTLMCRTHNVLMAERDYGTDVMARFRRSARPVSGNVAPPSLRSSPRRWRSSGH
jgi:5-methylcytosine-specific restriction endonuclease McrA